MTPTDTLPYNPCEYPGSPHSTPQDERVPQLSRLIYGLPLVTWSSSKQCSSDTENIPPTEETAEDGCPLDLYEQSLIHVCLVFSNWILCENT